jgi:hypothetical protein
VWRKWWAEGGGIGAERPTDSAGSIKRVEQTTQVRQLEMSAVEMARAAKQARLERLAPPPIVAQLEEQGQDENLREPEPEPMPEQELHVDDLGRTTNAYDEVVELDEEVIELDDTEPSPAAGVVCPWEIVTPPAPSSCYKSEQGTQKGEVDGVDAVLPRWTGEGALPLPHPQQRADDNDHVPKQAQLDTALAEALQKQLLLDHAEEVRLKELGAARHFAAAHPQAPVTSSQQPQQVTIPAQVSGQRYRNFDYDEAFDVEDDELDGYDDRPWMTANRVCEAH